MDKASAIAAAAVAAQDNYRQRCREIRGHCGLRVYRVTESGYVLLCGSCTTRFEVEGNEVLLKDEDTASE